jgi:pyrimidine deaminase RibD-like protein
VKEGFSMTDRKFMEMAVEAARRATPEDQRRPRPLVGAAIAQDDRVSTAYRGQRGRGEHAEYTLLNNLDWTPTHATLYTTLEPCVTRWHPKRPCADRIIETGGINHVVIGMLDPNPTITGKGILRLREAGMAVSLFDADFMGALEEMNRDFIGEYRPLSARIGGGILALEAGKRRLDDWYVAINSIYFGMNFHRTADSLLAHMIEVVGGLGPLASGKKTSIVPTEHVAKSVAWWMALCGKIGVKSVEEMVWAKFPAVCPYCLKNPHKPIACKVHKQNSKTPEWETLQKIAATNGAAKPSTLAEWQRMFGHIYEVPELPFTIAKLTEEMGELAEAVRIRHVKPGFFLNEASDAFAWLMQLQNALDRNSLESEAEIGLPLEQAFASGYPDRCSRCHNQICSCSPVAADTIGRIAHDMPVAAQDLLSLEATLDRFGRWRS